MAIGKNVGGSERIARFALGAIVLLAARGSSGWSGRALRSLGLSLVATAIVQRSYLNSVLGRNTYAQGGDEGAEEATTRERIASLTG